MLFNGVLQVELKMCTPSMNFFMCLFASAGLYRKGNLKVSLIWGSDNIGKFDVKRIYEIPWAGGGGSHKI